jgi:ATP-binding cassette subfamily F protein uup
MSFKDKHALETLPAHMEKLREELEQLEQVLADPALYSRDPKLFEKTSLRIGVAREDLAMSEDHWLTLEMMREDFAQD